MQGSTRGLWVSRVLAVCAVFLFVGFRYGEPMWTVDQDVDIVGLMFSCVLLICMIAYARFASTRRGGLALQVRHLVVTLLVVIPLIFAFFILNLKISRVVLVFESVLFLALLALNFSGFRTRMVMIANVCLFLVALVPSLSSSSISSFRETVLGVSAVKSDPNVQYIFTSRVDLKVTTTRIIQGDNQTPGGGIAPIDENHLLVGTATGGFFVVDIGSAAMPVRETTMVAPVNLQEYQQQAEPVSPWFRVTDVYLEQTDRPVRSLYVSHHHWDVDRKCTTLRVSEAQVDVRDLEHQSPQWTTRFESSPCLPGDVSNENGGRMDFLPPHSMLVTVGSNEVEMLEDGIRRLDDSTYGKIFEIDTRTWESRPFSIGHRNAQGLLVTEDGIWETEHGPQGGDELNFVVRGQDYGWPRSTYGTAYGHKEWPYLAGPAEHSFGRKPVYAWVPSIGVSNLVQIKGPLFKAWNHDLIVGSLVGMGNGHSLFRLKIEDGHVIFAARILTGRPVRDLVEDARGRLLLWDGTTSLQTVEPTPQQVFSQCSGCHALRWKSRGIGPDLMGIVGDKVARDDGFSYSAALRDFGGRWTKDRLDQFLLNPQEAVPGTTMRFPGIADAQNRAEVIDYLSKLKIADTVSEGQAEVEDTNMTWWQRLLAPAASSRPPPPE